MPENILIEFTADTTGLAPAIDQLEALGKVDKESANLFRQTNTELKNRTTELNKVGTSTSKITTENKKTVSSVKDLEKAFKGMTNSFIQGFQQGILDELKRAGIETNKLGNEVKKTAEGSKSLRAELRHITEQLAILKTEGKDNTDQYRQLSAAASKYRDALGDVSREINRAASDTQKLDTMVEFATGVAGAFSIAQGAAGLFGDESKELQEVLLRVQSSMAILNGLQSIQNILQKESNLIRLVSNQQLKLQVVLTNLETAAQSKNIIVKGIATGAMKVLNAVMSANPAFLLIAAFAALAGALIYFTSKTDNSKEAVKKLNQELFDLNNNIDAAIKGVQNQAEINQAKLDQLGAVSSQKTQQRIKDLRRENVEAITGLYKAQQQQLAIDKQIAAGTIKNNEDVQKTRDGFIEAQYKYRDIVLANNQEIKVAEINTVKEIKDERKEANDKSIEEAKKRKEKEREIRLAGLEDIKAGIQLQLLEVKKGSEAEVKLKQQLLQAQLNIDLDNEKLTANQRKLLIQQSFKERIQLEKDFSAEIKKVNLENLQSNLNAELQNIDIANDRKVDLTIQLLEVQRQLELSAVIGNKQKEKEINAKFDKEIADQAVAIRKAGLDEELRLLEAQQGARKRALERTASDVNADIILRITAINELLRIETDSLGKRKAQNEKFYKDGLISAKEYYATLAELADKEAKAVEDAEQRKRDAAKKTKDDKEEADRILIQKIVDGAAIGINTLAAIYDFQANRENAHIELQKQRIKDLQDSGAITEKEARERLKRIEAEERKIKTEQAVRNKRIEFFNSLLAIPAAYLKGLKDGGPLLALFYAGLAGVQSGFIAAKQIPKFGRGKKNQYEGIAQVGESGPELIERNGKYMYADKPQIIWLSKSDKVYNPKETLDMINRPLPVVDKRIMNFSNSTSGKLNIDYEKLGKAVGKNIPQVGFNFDEEGFTQYQKDKNSFTKYLNNRRSF